MQQMRTFELILMLLSLCLPLRVLAASRPAAAQAGWSAPVVAYAQDWPDPLYFSLDDSGTHLVALIPYSGSSETSRHIVVSEYAGGAWQTPVIVAQNGAWSDASFQVMPQSTHPMMSGDGNTIAYVGYTGSTYGVYTIDRVAGRSWQAPVLVPAGLLNTHYWISLSQDGNTLALCDYPFLGIQQVYVMTRHSGSWSAPVLIGSGGDPSLSADGARLTYISNARVAYSERSGDQWGAPQQLTDNNGAEYMAEFPQFSADGRAIFYWLVQLVPEGAVSVRTAQDLYVMRQAAGVWGAPQKVTDAPTLPVAVTDGPAAASRQATRLIYTRAVTTTDPGDGHVYVEASHLELAEWTGDQWQHARLVEANGYGNYNKWPRLTPDGRQLIFDGGIRYTGDGAIYNALWQMTADAPPQPLPLPTTTVAAIPASGGELFSEIDGVHYLFAPGTFTATVVFTHTVWNAPPPPPPGMIGVPGIGGLGVAFDATTMLGPGGLPIQPALPVTVTVGYGALGGGSAISGTLGLWWWNLGGWTQVPSIDDPATQTVAAEVTHFSQFAVFGETNRVYLPVIDDPE